MIGYNISEVSCDINNKPNKRDESIYLFLNRRWMK